MLLQKFQETLTINWSFNNVIYNNTIQGDGRNDGKPCSLNKVPLDTTVNTSCQPSMLKGRCPLIFGSCVNENKHIGVWHLCSNVIHVHCMHLCISLCSWSRNDLLGDNKDIGVSEEELEAFQVYNTWPKFLAESHQGR